MSYILFGAAVLLTTGLVLARYKVSKANRERAERLRQLARRCVRPRSEDRNLEMQTPKRRL